MFSYAVVKEGATMRSNQAIAGGAGRGQEVPVAARRRGAYRAYQWALLAFLVAGMTQIFLAGLGVFSLQDRQG